MELISDILLALGAACAGAYCFILSRKLAALKNIEGGVGEVVNSLADQVEELNRSLQLAKSAASNSNNSLIDLTQRAEQVAGRLELMVASMHDIPGETKNAQVKSRQDAVTANSDTPMFSTRVGRL